MKVLHILDHSLPVGSGYSYRSRSIVLSQKRLGLEPVVLTSPKHGSPGDGEEAVEGIRHYRTGPAGGRLPFARELRLMARLTARMSRVAREERVQVIHAHFPLLNGLPALWTARRLGLRMVYEVRTFWEDAAVNHGTFAEGSLRYRLSRSLETLVFRRADAFVAICRGIRAELAAMRHYLEDPVPMARHGRAARELAQSEFSLERMVGAYEQLYGQLLRARGLR